MGGTLAGTATPRQKEGRLRVIGANKLDWNITLTISNSSHAITFTIRTYTLGKDMRSLIHKAIVEIVLQPFYKDGFGIK